MSQAGSSAFDQVDLGLTSSGLDHLKVFQREYTLGDLYWDIVLGIEDVWYWIGEWVWYLGIFAVVWLFFGWFLGPILLIIAPYILIWLVFAYGSALVE